MTTVSGVVGLSFVAMAPLPSLDAGPATPGRARLGLDMHADAIPLPVPSKQFTRLPCESFVHQWADTPWRWKRIRKGAVIHRG